MPAINNTWRVAHGLEPIYSGKTEKAKANGAKRQQAANAAARAQANRDMKANRGSNKKAR